MDTMQEFEWFSGQDLSAYAGEWVAIVGKEVVAHGKDVKTLLEAAKARFPKQEPLIAKVPPKSLQML